MGRIQKVSNQSQINIFEALMNDHVPLKDRTPEIRKNTPTTKDKEIQDNSQSRRDEWDNIKSAEADTPKLRHNFLDEVDLTRNSSSIRSARCAPDGITNNKSSDRFVGSNSNSVWSADDLDKIANSSTAKENMAEERESSKKMRDLKQAEYRNSQLPKLGESEESYLTNKGDSITSNHTQGGGYNPPAGKISIFDNEDFERVSDHKMEVRKAKKDDSWKTPRRNMSTKDMGDGLIDKLSSDSEDSKYKSLHKNSVDRIFEAIVNKNEEN